METRTPWFTGLSQLKPELGCPSTLLRLHPDDYTQVLSLSPKAELPLGTVSPTVALTRGHAPKANITHCSLISVHRFSSGRSQTHSSLPEAAGELVTVVMATTSQDSCPLNQIPHPPTLGGLLLQPVAVEKSPAVPLTRTKL